MPDELARILDGDQHDAHKARAIGEQVGAYWAAITGAGIPAEVAGPMVQHFSAAWVEDQVDALGMVGIAIFGEDEL